MKIKSIFKKLSGLTLVGFLFLSITTFAQSISKASLNKKTSITLLSDDGTTTKIKFSVGSYQEQSVLTPKGYAVIIKTEMGTQMLKAGYPDLPKLTSSIIIPDDKEMEVTVESSVYEDYENVNVAPSKGTLVRTIDPATIPYQYNNVYSDDAFFPKNITELRVPFILRDYRAQTVMVFPFQYNPITKILRVYSEIIVKISPKKSGAATNVFVRSKPIEKIQTDFGDIYKNRFLNYNSGTRYTPLVDHGNMLIICDGNFMDEMQPFVDWKIQEGIKTEIVDVATIGNDQSSIKNYVADYYNTNGLTFLLLAGDHTQVNSYYINGLGYSDNEFGYITGNDHYQEIFVGRISAEADSDIINQVAKIIEYEKNPLIDSYYVNGIAIGSADGAGIGDDGEADWEHEQNIRTQLLGYTYTAVQELFDGTKAGGNDAAGNPSAIDLATNVNAGAGIINYTGHGGSDKILTTNFSNSDVLALTNNHRYPFVFVVGCETGNFTGQTCFAEAWQRTEYQNLPAGSVANFMSTINQYWAEPMQAQDEFNAILTESYADNKPRSFGGICINSCFSMNDEYGDYGFDMTDTWCLFGDPSLMIRTALPSSMQVTHDPQIFLGTNNFTVSCDFDGALVSLTQDENILGTEWVNSGTATVLINPLLNSDSVLITVTAFNKIPFQNKIPTQVSASPVIVNTANIVNDVAGNNNGLADYNETVALDVTLLNVGAGTANAITATLATTDPFVTITNSSAYFGNIIGNNSISQNSSFTFTIADDVPDQHISLFVISISDSDGNTWLNNFPVTLNAPLLSVVNFAIDDSNGNGNGYLEPGETATITISNTNTGHSNAVNAIADLFESSTVAEIISNAITFDTIKTGETNQATFTVEVYNNAPYGINLPFTYNIAAGSYNADDSFTTIIAPAIEDFETDNFLKFDWQLSGNQNWFTQSSTFFEGQFAARSGAIANNQSSTLTILLDAKVAGDISFEMKVSSEGNFDSLTFHIDDVSKGKWSGEIGWAAKTFTVDSGIHLYEWTYQKDNLFSSGSDCAWLDNILFPPYKINPDAGIENISANENASCYPNPFSKISFINYSLNKATDVTIKVFDVLGNEIITLINNQQQSTGNYQLGFDGTDLVNGIYFCHFNIGEKNFVKKLVLNKLAQHK